jgi:TolB-like protein/AraC-like DNA-binding protein/Tfp pilus assembly protein PilF
MNKLSSISSQDERDKIFVSKLTEIVTANLANDKFDVKELAEESAMSPKTLNRKLKAVTGKTIGQFIREIRLLKAWEMLQNGEITASEVSFKVGFSSPTYFNTCFHEFFGCTPGAAKNGDTDVNGKLNSIHTRKPLRLKKVHRRTLLYIPAGILLLLVLVLSGYFFFNKPGASDSPGHNGKAEISIAVLPFKNLSSSLDDKYFIEGVMDEILTDLCRIHDLRVISRTSVEQFRESTLSASVIGKKLNADYLVEGSGQKYGNRFSLRVQLIDASGDRHIWAESFVQEINGTSDIIRIQSQAAQSIAAELKATITPAEKQLIEQIPTGNLTAYDYYQRGREELAKNGPGNKTTQSINRAKEMFMKALECDSTFALAYIGLTDIYTFKHFHQSYFSKNYLDSVLILTDRALSYDDHLAEAYAHRGSYYLSLGKTEQAIEEYEKALKYKPNYWEIYSSVGWNVYYLDYKNMDYVKGLEYLEKAASINRGKELPDLLRDLASGYRWAGFPGKANYFHEEAFKLDGDSIKYLKSFCGEAFINGDYGKAAERLREVHERDSDNVFIMWQLAIACSYTGQYEEALKYVKRIENKLETYPSMFYSSMGGIGYVYWKNGYKKEAEQWFSKQTRMSEESLNMGRYYSVDANHDLAALYAFKGEKEKAYDNLRKVSEIRVCPIWLLSMIKNEPQFNSMRDEPEFKRIVSKLESKIQAEHERVRKWLETKGQL